jgi:hypothetical protein
MSSSEQKKSIVSLSDDELDALIMTKVNHHWAKVARIVGATMTSYSSNDEARIISRIIALVKNGALEKAGDVNNPSFSEIRLPKAGIAGVFDEGLSAFAQKNYAAAFELFEKCSKQGEGGASWRIGEMYTNGLGTNQDFVKAEHWYKTALAQGFFRRKKV